MPIKMTVLWTRITKADPLPRGDWLVFLEKEMLGLRIHTAQVEKNLTVIGGRFDYDCPRPTHYAPLPQEPTDD